MNQTRQNFLNKIRREKFDKEISQWRAKKIQTLHKRFGCSPTIAELTQTKINEYHNIIALFKKVSEKLTTEQSFYLFVSFTEDANILTNMLKQTDIDFYYQLNPSIKKDYKISKCLKVDDSDLPNPYRNNHDLSRQSFSWLSKDDHEKVVNIMGKPKQQKTLENSQVKSEVSTAEKTPNEKSIEELESELNKLVQRPQRIQPYEQYITFPQMKQHTEVLKSNEKYTKILKILNKGGSYEEKSETIDNIQAIDVWLKKHADLAKNTFSRTKLKLSFFYQIFCDSIFNFFNHFEFVIFCRNTISFVKAMKHIGQQISFHIFNQYPKNSTENIYIIFGLILASKDFKEPLPDDLYDSLMHELIEFINEKFKTRDTDEKIIWDIFDIKRFNDFFGCRWATKETAQNYYGLLRTNVPGHIDQIEIKKVILSERFLTNFFNDIKLINLIPIDSKENPLKTELENEFHFDSEIGSLVVSSDFMETNMTNLFCFLNRLTPKNEVNPFLLKNMSRKLASQSHSYSLVVDKSTSTTLTNINQKLTEDDKKAAEFQQPDFSNKHLFFDNCIQFHSELYIRLYMIDTMSFQKVLKDKMRQYLQDLPECYTKQVLKRIIEYYKTHYLKMDKNGQMQSLQFAGERWYEFHNPNQRHYEDRTDTVIKTSAHMKDMNETFRQMVETDETLKNMVDFEPYDMIENAKSPNDHETIFFGHFMLKVISFMLGNRFVKENFYKKLLDIYGYDKVGFEIAKNAFESDFSVKYKDLCIKSATVLKVSTEDEPVTINRNTIQQMCFDKRKTIFVTKFLQGRNGQTFSIQTLSNKRDNCIDFQVDYLIKSTIPPPDDNEYMIYFDKQKSYIYAFKYKGINSTNIYIDVFSLLRKKKIVTIKMVNDRFIKKQHNIFENVIENGVRLDEAFKNLFVCSSTDLHVFKTRINLMNQNSELGSKNTPKEMFSIYPAEQLKALKKIRLFEIDPKFSSNPYIYLLMEDNSFLIYQYSENLFTTTTQKPILQVRYKLNLMNLLKRIFLIEEKHMEPMTIGLQRKKTGDDVEDQTIKKRFYFMMEKDSIDPIKRSTRQLTGAYRYQEENYTTDEQTNNYLSHEYVFSFTKVNLETEEIIKEDFLCEKSKAISSNYILTNSEIRPCIKSHIFQSSSFSECNSLKVMNLEKNVYELMNFKSFFTKNYFAMADMSRQAALINRRHLLNDAAVDGALIGHHQRHEYHRVVIRHHDEDSDSSDEEINPLDSDEEDDYEEDSVDYSEGTDEDEGDSEVSFLFC